MGLRHGIDWDHIAAISDITTSSKERKEAIVLGTMYALGHAVVILLLGILAIAIGIRLPGFVDSIMEPIVGVTLIFLGLYLAFSILRYGKKVHLQSRWMVLFALLTKVYDHVHFLFGHPRPHSHKIPSQNIGLKAAIGIGVIHGIGAETPTQLLLFTTAAGVGGKPLGILIVCTFVVGLIISNSLITLFSIFGIAKIQKNSTLYLFLAGVTAIFSFILGIVYLL